MHIIAIGIIVAIILFKIYPTKSDNTVKRRIVQLIVSIALLIGIVISFIFMKFMIGIILGVIGIFYAFRQRKKQFDGALRIANLIKDVSQKD